MEAKVPVSAENSLRSQLPILFLFLKQLGGRDKHLKGKKEEIFFSENKGFQIDYYLKLLFSK